MTFNIKPISFQTWVVELPDQEEFNIIRVSPDNYEVVEVFCGLTPRKLTTQNSFEAALAYITEYTKYDW